MNNVNVTRTIYTASSFTKETLFYLQEVGKSETISRNVNSRNKLDSFLFFIVLEGDGVLDYNSREYMLKKNDCVFIDCNYPHSHTSTNWKILWVHINGPTLKNIYDNYLHQSGKNVFKTDNTEKYINIIESIRLSVSSGMNIKDIEINTSISSLLSIIISDNSPAGIEEKRKYNFEKIKFYLDENFINDISLDSLSSIFFINKFYLTRTFKEKYGTTVNNYIIEKRINKAKELLRYSDMSVNEISKECGFSDQNYFSRTFRNKEGMSPIKYRNTW